MPRKSSKNKECLIAGNWKMYKTIEEAKQFVENVTPLLNRSQDTLNSVQVWLAVPFTAIHPTRELVKEISAPLTIGAQNMFDASEGAFTGEIAGRMLKEAGASFVILGHSERRHLFHESDAFINNKVKRALLEGLTPILCVGELEEERDNGEMAMVLERQLAGSLHDLSEEDVQRIILAYEPVWAIGTGKTATPENAEEAHAFCRGWIQEKWGKKVSNKLKVIYGGSVRPNNARLLLEQPNIDGLLVGGCSLDPTTFSQIVNCKEL